MSEFADKYVVRERRGRFRPESLPIVMAATLMLVSGAGATSVPSLSFEELVKQSELVVSGQVNRSWSDWDAENKYIWTHYELSVASTQKGSPGRTVVISEPGGVVGNRAMAIAGAVAYAPGDRVAVFLQRMPNGYLRTTGWGQGKYVVDDAGHLHADSSLRGLEVVKVNSPNAGETSLRTLEGISLGQLRRRVAAVVGEGSSR